MKRRLLVIDANRRTYSFKSLTVETLPHDPREDYFTVHGEALCQYILRRDPAALIIARGPLAFLAGNKATVGYISPLTGMPHYSFVGGRAAAQLFALGLDAVVFIRGDHPNLYVVVSGRAPDLDVRFVDAAELPGGFPTGQRSAHYYLVERELGGIAESGSVFTLGEGATYGYASANIAVEGMYHAGRGGAGGVLARSTRALVLKGDIINLETTAREDILADADPSFRASPNRAIASEIERHTARLSGKTGGTVVKLYNTGKPGTTPTLPSRNGSQLGYELAELGGKRILAATRDGHAGCHWCPVDCRHWHWVDVDYAPDGRDRFLDDFEPTYAIHAMLGLGTDATSHRHKLALLRAVDERVMVPIEQMGCDVIDIGVGLAALLEGIERGAIPAEDVPPELRHAGLSDEVSTPAERLDAAALAVDLLRSQVTADTYPALRAAGDGPQALAERYPAMQAFVFSGGAGTLANAGHSNALWTFMMPFSRFFSHYSGQIYKIDKELPRDPNDEEALQAVFRQVVDEMYGRELMSILCNALSCCAFVFTIFTQDGKGTALDAGDLLVRTLAQYGIRTIRHDLMWFAQAFWAQSVDYKSKLGWQPPTAGDFPCRIYEALSQALGQPPETLFRWMDLLTGEWETMARERMRRFGFEPGW